MLGSEVGLHLRVGQSFSGRIEIAAARGDVVERRKQGSGHGRTVPCFAHPNKCCELATGCIDLENGCDLD